MSHSSVYSGDRSQWTSYHGNEYRHPLRDNKIQFSILYDGHLTFQTGMHISLTANTHSAQRPGTNSNLCWFINNSCQSCSRYRPKGPTQSQGHNKIILDGNSNSDITTPQRKYASIYHARCGKIVQKESRQYNLITIKYVFNWRTLAKT